MSMFGFNATHKSLMEDFTAFNMLPRDECIQHVPALIALLEYRKYRETGTGDDSQEARRILKHKRMNAQVREQASKAIVAIGQPALAELHKRVTRMASQMNSGISDADINQILSKLCVLDVIGEIGSTKSLPVLISFAMRDFGMLFFLAGPQDKCNSVLEKVAITIKAIADRPENADEFIGLPVLLKVVKSGKWDEIWDCRRIKGELLVEAFGDLFRIRRGAGRSFVCPGNTDASSPPQASHSHHKRYPLQFVTGVNPHVRQHYGQRRRMPL